MGLWARPIEDPQRISRFTAGISTLDWTESSFRVSSQALFCELSALVHAEIIYYYRRRCASRRLSRLCRFLAWGSATVGLLVPLAQPLVPRLESSNLLLWWGYLAFGIAGAALAFDSLFAGTHAHQRHAATQLELEKAYTVFVLEWQARLIKLAADGSVASVLELVNGAVSFATELHRILGAETSAWQLAVNRALSELKGKLQTKTGAEDATSSAHQH